MPKGRTRIDGPGKKPLKHCRTAVSNYKKLKTINWYREHGIASTLDRFFGHIAPRKQKTSRNQIHVWNKQREVLEEACRTAKNGSKQKNRSVGVATSLPVDAELDIVHWVNDLRNEGIPISIVMLQLQALDIATEYRVCHFEVSTTWQRLFRRRHRLSMRCRTRQGQIAPAEAKKIAADFAVKIRAKMAELGVTRVYNADQTAVLYEYLPKKTLSRRGDKTIWVRGGNKEKKRLIVILLGNSDGDKYPPMLVYKSSKSTVPETALVNIRDRHGFGIGIWKQIEPLQIETAMPIYGNTKGWFNNELVMKFLEHYFAERTDSGTPVLLLLDDFTGHWTAEVAAYAKRLNVVLERVPPGCTSVCQPADIAWMKPLKDRLRRKWVSSIRDQLRARVPGQPFKMKAPDRIVMARWIKAVWDDMPPSTIRNGFRKADFIDREEASRGELQAPEEVDKDDDVVALLEESGLLDLDVGVIDSDDDLDL